MGEYIRCCQGKLAATILSLKSLNFPSVYSVSMEEFSNCSLNTNSWINEFIDLFAELKV